MKIESVKNVVVRKVFANNQAMTWQSYINVPFQPDEIRLVNQHIYENGQQNLPYLLQTDLILDEYVQLGESSVPVYTNVICQANKAPYNKNFNFNLLYVDANSQFTQAFATANFSTVALTFSFIKYK